MDDFKRWLQMARDDLNSAKDNFGIKRYYVAAQLAQQAAEKALKALLLKETRELARVHDLAFLAKGTGASKALISKCEELSAVYIETKYGGRDYTPSEKFKEGNTLGYLEIAEEIVKWAEKQT